MEPVSWKIDGVIDAHVHQRSVEPLEHFKDNMRLANNDKICLLAVPGPKGAEMNRTALELKKESPTRYYVFGCVEHDPAKIESGDGSYLADQVETLIDSGCDGLKMYSGSPRVRKAWMPLDFDNEYFYPLWEKTIELDTPITSHVSEPISYWQSENAIPRPSSDGHAEFIGQAENVLNRYPNLRINFPHFMFLSPQLNKLASIFERFPEVMIDLAMGNEFLYYLSADPGAGHDFFTTWQDRILYGTDLNDVNSSRHAHAKAEILRLFLETDENFEDLVSLAMNRVPTPGANGLLEFHGLNLSDEVLEKVLRTNFQKFAGTMPKALN